ncbi:hypothetical protein, partial [Amycolatopsis sp. w19]|uniref:hypothetical protein n=1 Tax=Amycolatopsis sp. w19 TaxID=3448134 RepID=UPI003F1D53F4
TFMVLGVAAYEEAGAAAIPIPIASEETILITRLFIVLSPFINIFSYVAFFYSKINFTTRNHPLI